MPDAFTPLRGPRMGPDGRRIRKGWTPGRVQPQGQAPAPHHPRSVSGVSGCPPPAGRGSLQRASSAPGSLRPGSRPRPVLRPLTAAGHAVLLTSCQCLAPCPGHPAAAPDRPFPQALPWPRVPCGTWALRRHLSFGQQQHPLLPVGGAQARGGQGHPFSLFHPEALCRALQDRQASQA